MRHIFILMKLEFELGSEIIMIWIWNKGSCNHSCGGKVGTPHFLSKLTNHERYIFILMKLEFELGSEIIMI